MANWQVMEQGSQTRVLATILGSQEKKEESKTAGGIILTGSATKEKDADFGKIAKVVNVSIPDGPLKVGMIIVIGPRSGRSAIKTPDGSVCVLNRDEIWAYDPDSIEGDK